MRSEAADPTASESADGTGSIGAGHLREMSPLVVMREIQAGDVLLIRSAGLDSTLIAVASGGRFSHAAIWLPFDTKDDDGEVVSRHLTLVESDDNGVGETSLRRVVIHREGSGGLFCFRLDGRASHAEVWRHPRLGEVPPVRLREAASELRGSEFYKAYSELHRLADATRRHPLLKSAMRQFLRHQDKADTELVKGTFCSELVAKYFELVGLPLMKVDQHSSTISPSDLAGASSCLERRPGAVVNAADIVDTDTASPSRHDTTGQRARYLPSMVRFLSRAKRSQDRIEELSSKFDEMAIGAIGEGAAGARERFQRAVEERQSALGHGDDRAAYHLERNAELALIIVEIYGEWLQRRLSGSGRGATGVSAASEIRLAATCRDLTRDCDRAFARTHALLHMRRARSLWRQGQREAGLTRMMRTLQSALVRNWTSLRADLPDLRNFDEAALKAIGDGRSVDLIQAECDEVIAAAVTAAAMAD